MGDTVNLAFDCGATSPSHRTKKPHHSPRFRRFVPGYHFFLSWALLLYNRAISLNNPNTFFSISPHSLDSSLPVWLSADQHSPDDESVMLASIPPMETARSFPRDPSAPSRHPSAEDLDAAQQLISSAQVGRERLAQYGNSTSIKVSGSPPPNPHGPPSAGQLSDGRSNGRSDRSSPKAQKDTSFLGHSCR